MNTTNKITTKKRIYCAPLVESVKLDNEISLILESNPPFGPDENLSQVTEYFNNDPYKFSLV